MHGRVWPAYLHCMTAGDAAEIEWWQRVVAAKHTLTTLAPTLILPQVAFEEGRVATPELTADLQLPSSLDVLGQRVDLAPLQVCSWLLPPIGGLYCVPWLWVGWWAALICTAACHLA